MKFYKLRWGSILNFWKAGGKFHIIKNYLNGPFVACKVARGLSLSLSLSHPFLPSLSIPFTSAFCRRALASLRCHLHLVLDLSLFSKTTHSLSMTLSLSTSVSRLSLSLHGGFASIGGNGGEKSHTCQSNCFRGRRMVKDQLRGSQLAVVVVCVTRVDKLWLADIASPSLATPTVGSMSQHTHLNLFVTIVPSVCDESA